MDFQIVCWKMKNLKKAYWEQTLDKFVKEYLLPDVETLNGQPDFSSQKEENTDTDMVRNHAMQLLKYFFLLEDIKNAVKEGNGQRLNQLCKQLLHHFKTDDGHNTYAIEMLINVE